MRKLIAAVRQRVAASPHGARRAGARYRHRRRHLKWLWLATLALCLLTPMKSWPIWMLFSTLLSFAYLDDD